jgi:hypothetical protein
MNLLVTAPCSRRFGRLATKPLPGVCSIDLAIVFDQHNKLLHVSHTPKVSVTNEDHFSLARPTHGGRLFVSAGIVFESQPVLYSYLERPINNDSIWIWRTGPLTGIRRFFSLYACKID